MEELNSIIVNKICCTAGMDWKRCNLFALWILVLKNNLFMLNDFLVELKSVAADFVYQRGWNS